MKRKDEKPWTVHGGRPSDEAILRAYMVLLDRPPIIRPEVLAEIKRDREERARADEAKKAQWDIAAGVIRLCSCDCRRHLS